MDVGIGCRNAQHILPYLVKDDIIIAIRMNSFSDGMVIDDE
jgi:hypothetical protein